jgi:hypothetical protein
VIVIGNGSWSFIKAYRELLSCPYAIYAQPSKSIYKRFGMLSSLKSTPAGDPRPSYVKSGLLGITANGRSALPVAPQLSFCSHS